MKINPRSYTINGMPQATGSSGQSAVPHRGFALIATISVMVLLVMIALAMLSLSTITLRSSRQDTHAQEAKANARLALMLAIGELQMSMGPDQRVTATGSLWTSPKAGTEHLVGVWSSEDANGDGSPDGNFVRWLVSRADSADAKEITMVETAMPIAESGGVYTAGDDYELLVGGGSVAQNSLYPTVMQGVVAEKRDLLDAQGTTVGRYAWWVGDEGVKANANQIDPYSHDLLDQASSPWATDPQWAQLSTQSMQGTSLGAIASLSSVDPVTDPELAADLNNSMSVNQMPLLNFGSGLADRKTLVKQQFHSLTSHSLGLQTNLKEGGLKRDLSLLFEMAAAEFDDPAGDFMKAMTADGLDYTGAPGPKSDIALTFKQDIDSSYGDGVIYGPSWDMLRDYYRLYKGVASSSATQPTLPENWVHTFSPGKAWLLGSGSESEENEAWYKGLALNSWRVRGGASKDPSTVKQINTQTNFWGISDKSFPAIRPTKGAYFPYLSRSTLFYTTVSSGGTLDVIVQPFIAFHNPYNVKMHAPKMRSLYQFENSSELYVRRGNGGGWLASRPFRTGKFTAAGHNHEGNVYSSATGGSPVSLSNHILTNTSESKAFGGVFGSELTFNVPEADYEPGEVKLFVVASKASFADREVDLVPLGGGYDPLNGVYLELPTENMFVDHDDDDGVSTPRLPLLNGITPGEEVMVRMVMGGYQKMAYEIYNKSQNKYDHAASYYAPTGASGNLVYGRKLSQLQSEDLGVYEEYMAPVVEFSVGLPHIGMDSFIKPLNFSETLTQGGTMSDEQKTFPNFIASNPLAASFSASGMGKEPGNYVAYIENSGLGNMYHTSAEHFKPSEGGNAPRLLFTADKGTWGTNNGDAGIERTVITEIPSAPLQSIGQLQHAVLSASPYNPLLSIGNSFRSPYLQDASQTEFAYESWTKALASEKYQFVFHDQNYLMNEALWDGYFFSSIAPHPSDGSYQSADPSSASDPFTSDIPAVVQSFINADPALANSRMRYMASPAIGGDVAADLIDFETSAQHLAVDGSFNINSTSVDAWTAFLAGYRDSKIQYFDGTSYREEAPDGYAAFLRQSLPGGAGADSGTTINSSNAWAGFLKLTDEEIQDLATKIVADIKARAAFRGTATEPRPALTLAQFVNRSLTADLAYADGGTLQTAIEATSINDARLKPSSEFKTSAYNRSSKPSYYKDSSYSVNAANVSPIALTQADILQAIGPAISGRSDTFKVRAYGESLDSSGKVVARAWCEAVCQRTTEEDAPGSTVDFGRKFKIISFRWLTKDEV